MGANETEKLLQPQVPECVQSLEEQSFGFKINKLEQPALISETQCEVMHSVQAYKQLSAEELELIDIGFHALGLSMGQDSRKYLENEEETERFKKVQKVKEIWEKDICYQKISSKEIFDNLQTQVSDRKSKRPWPNWIRQKPRRSLEQKFYDYTQEAFPRTFQED